MESTSLPEQFKLSYQHSRPFLISNLTCFVPNLPKSLVGYKIAHLSDFHLGAATSISHIAAAIAQVNVLNPDLVCLTGDFIQYCRFLGHALATKFNPDFYRWVDYRRAVRGLAKELGEVLETIEAQDGVLSVFGNHDYLEGLGTIVRQFPQSIKWLTNSSVTIKRDNGFFIVAGIDDLNRGKPNIERAIEHATELEAEEHKLSKLNSSFRVLLSHNPDITIKTAAKNINQHNLMLCGHTHGGQVRFPLVGPIVTRTKQKKHVQGLSQLNNTAIYVTNGAGYGGLGVRYRCPPEIVMIRLVNR